MEKATRKELFRVAKDMARAPFHGTFDGLPSNLAPIVRLFPTWSVKEADGLWCAAFVYYCCTEAGDIVIYDRVFENREHDHMGIILEKREHTIIAAEGNINNKSGIIERSIDGHIRAYIRIPDGYQYSSAE